VVLTKLLIEHTASGVRTALTENNRLKEIYIDNDISTSRVGEVVVGRIRTIMPGQFAFIDIDAGKNAFANLKPGHAFKTGQPILVQVQKDATSSKGAYVSTDINLKGRLVVLHKSPPGEVGVSHKISDEKETRRLKKIVRALLPAGYGAIVRTNAGNCDKETIADEINKLYQEYETIISRGQYALPPAKLYPEDKYPFPADLISDSLDEIHISGTEEAFATIKRHICEISDITQSLSERIFHYDGKLLEHFGVKKQISRALEKVVDLPSGGFITIEQTEACVVVDVNTGNSAGAASYRETVLNANLEAAKTIIDQIILRNLSGTIIIDFIDMPGQQDKSALMEVLVVEARRDRLNPEIIGMSKLGIVQMARAKKRLSLSQVLEINCPHCGGKGRTKQ